jgi:hypothetical protein
VSLKDARTRRDEARKLVAADVDPGENRKALKAAKDRLLAWMLHKPTVGSLHGRIGIFFYFPATAPLPPAGGVKREGVVGKGGRHRLVGQT